MSEFVTLARPYAKAAFDFAKESNLVSDWLGKLTLSAGLANVKEIASEFISPEKDKAELVSLLSGENSDSGYINFIKLLADNDRLGLLPEIVTLFKFISEKDAQALSADVFTAEELNDDQVEKIAKSLSKRTGKEVTITQHLDKSLLSGVRIQADDLVIDGSLKAKLEKLKSTLLN